MGLDYLGCLGFNVTTTPFDATTFSSWWFLTDFTNSSSYLLPPKIPPSYAPNSISTNQFFVLFVSQSAQANIYRKVSANSKNEDKDTTESYQAITAGHGMTQPQLPFHSPLEQLDTNVFERNCIARTDSEYNIVPILAMRIPTHFRSSDSAVPSSTTHREYICFTIIITLTLVSPLRYFLSSILLTHVEQKGRVNWEQQHAEAIVYFGLLLSSS